MKISYDRKIDVLYVELGEGPVGHTEDVSRGPYYERGVDHAEDGTPIGVEFLNASRGVDLTDIPRADEIAAELKARGFRILEGVGSDQVGS
jgi:uncharacterized protein YuzE